VTLSKA
jgi:hypothetical protein